MKSAVVAVAGIIIALSCAVGYKWRADERAWDSARSALVRLDSGVSYESLIQLRSRLADADAAVRNYAFDRRFFPLQHKMLVSNAQRGISYIGYALDWQTKSSAEPRVGEAGLSILEQRYPDVVPSFYSTCVNGEIFIPDASVEQSFIGTGVGIVRATEAKSVFIPSAPAPVFSRQKAKQECDVQYAAEQKAKIAQEKTAAEKYWSQFRYRVRLTLRPHQPGTCVADVDADHRRFQSIELYPDRTQQFGANRTMELEQVTCYGAMIPKDVIAVTVNEQPAVSRWVLNHAFILQ
jgi:hypothetical protein